MIPSTLIRLSVGVACALLGVLIEIGLDQVVAITPWLIVSFAVGVLAAVLGGRLGGSVALVIGLAAQLSAIPAWVPAAENAAGGGWQAETGAAITALLMGLWFRSLILHPRPLRGIIPRTTRIPVGGAERERDRPASPSASGSATVAGGARGPAGPTAPAAAARSQRTNAGTAATRLQPDLRTAVHEIGTARTPVQVADALARHAAAVGRARGAVVYLGRDGSNDFTPLGRFGPVDAVMPDHLPARSPTARADDTGVDADEPPWVDHAIRSGSTTFGVLRLVDGQADADRSDSGNLIGIVVQVAADALERGRLNTARRTAETGATAATGRLGILSRLAAALVGGSTVEDVARTLVDLAVDDLGAGFAVFHVRQPESDGFALVHARGYPEGLVARERSIDPGSRVPVTLAAQEQAIVEVTGEEGWRDAFPTASNVPSITGTRVISAIPMQVAGRIFGVLTIGWRSAPDRARVDRDLFATAADQGAQALERAILHAHDEDARRLQEAFIGVVSHELRTPITTILAGSRLLRRRLANDSRAAELSDDIEIEADRLSRIVDDLLVLSRLERRDLTIGDEPVHLDHLLTRVVRSEAARWPAHRIQIVPSIGSHVVRGEETYVEQVVRNLVSNAAKYSPAGSLVEISLDDAPDGEIRVGVLDQGPGVEPTEVDELFSLFYRSPRTAANAAGAGIGLFVSRRLVAEMGGRMWAKPRDSGGSEFGFSLGAYPVDESELDGAPPVPPVARL